MGLCDTIREGAGEGAGEGGTGGFKEGSAALVLIAKLVKECSANSPSHAASLLLALEKVSVGKKYLPK